MFSRQLLVEQVKNHLPHNNHDVFSYGSVTYQDKAVEISLPWTEVMDEGLAAVLDDYQIRRGVVNELYSTKNRDWESEQEFRIICVQWDVADDEADLAIDIPFEGTLVGVVLGEKYSALSDQSLRSLRSAPKDLDVTRCEWHGGVPILLK